MLKLGFIGRVLQRFNAKFDSGSRKYERLIQHTVKKKSLTIILILVFCGLAYWINMGLPSGFIPQEDQGMIYAVIETPPGATIERN